jgi:hypothetical protein
MVPSARRYDPVVDGLVRELDDPATSMAETCRRVAERVQQLGFTRPSLVHLRTLVRAERDQREAERRRAEELGEIARDIATGTLAGRVPDPHWILDRFERANG